jgi:hypothetical protein
MTGAAPTPPGPLKVFFSGLLPDDVDFDPPKADIRFASQDFDLRSNTAGGGCAT